LQFVSEEEDWALIHPQLNDGAVMVKQEAVADVAARLSRRTKVMEATMASMGILAQEFINVFTTSDISEVHPHPLTPPMIT